MGERRMPARYRMDETGQMRRTWNGKLPEEFNRQDMLAFAADTDMKIYGQVAERKEKEDIMENQEKTPEISVRVYPQQEKGNLLAFANITIGGFFAVRGVRVMESEKGPFIVMPSSKGSDDKYYDICFPTTAGMRQSINKAVLDGYQKAVEKPSLRGEMRSAAQEPVAHANQGKRNQAERYAR